MTSRKKIIEDLAKKSRRMKSKFYQNPKKGTKQRQAMWELDEVISILLIEGEDYEIRRVLNKEYTNALKELSTLIWFNGEFVRISETIGKDFQSKLIVWVAPDSEIK